MVVTTEELDMYSAKKLKASGIINGRILTVMRSFSLHGSFSGAAVVSSTLSGEVPIIVYSVSARS